ncbi:MAG: hypothetical protein AB7F43_02925 [Bacteriovoracia bacterium]
MSKKFPSQSQQKGSPQAKACGHAKSIRDCPECSKVVSLPTDKKQVHELLSKIQNLFSDEKNKTEIAKKAAQIIASWISKKP